MAAAGALQYRPYRDHALIPRAPRRLRALPLLLVLSACAAPPAACLKPGPDHETAWLLTTGWHTEIGVPAAALRGPIGWFRTVYPGAAVVLFGYGKRTFFTARADDLSAYILAPLPGRAVIQTMALNVAPDRAYAPGQVTAIPLAPAAMDRLTRAIWADFVLDPSGHPHLTNTGEGRVSLFYAARSRYTLTHDCNRWSCSLLHSAIPALPPEGVILASQTTGRLHARLPPLCRN
ncbi:DUF2459 domain-containing protein [Acidomonas methanolica]|uniref:DUF2459 domain-containing protein n=1 Tax=Acidomonas methanolica TaxID=437 RepID=UPI0009DFE2F4|nr:DUF2459 domain-containing protein [Acidomonas methanolica]